MSEWAGDHRCYFADPSGGFGWPSCVICGKPASTETERPHLRACCRTPEDGDHLPACASIDARARRRGRMS
ncbi:hypothetical protein I5G58_gp090 [Mycobacterium phage BirdsNest]|uniref:Uncharacterized protein n=1 Tax=Mycobacterium phage BirdsNest TaxID=2686231 RepID=A0A6B9L6V1_9CAUD|nr:hypothetical protein I5G58_gp090 [Mycobacterium phage BirdsNest]QHB37392.1 hypothetical protein PBI_BIRDSNEST_90 [Mycobacterium phage BirdsNest]